MPIRPLGSFADELDMGENTPAGTTVQKTGQAVKSAAATTANQVKQQIGVGDSAAAATNGILDALYGSSDGGDEPSPDNDTGVISHQQQKPQHGTGAPQNPTQANASGNSPRKQEDNKRIQELEAEIKKFADEREQRDRELDQEEEQEKQQMAELEVQKKKEPLAVLMAKKKTETFRGAGG